MITDDFYSYNTQYKNLPAAKYSEQDRNEWIASHYNV